MPVPYMGSKRVSAPKIVNLMKAYCPDATELYDVFCGGFTISEWAIKKGFKVHASDLNGAVVGLINEVLFGECKDPKTGISIFDKPRFIERAEFEAALNGNGWWGGYIQTVWSFGNGTGSYLFGRDLEEAKRAGHKLVVDAEITPEILAVVPKRYCEKIIQLPDWHVRRLGLRKVVALKDRRLELQQLQQLERLQQLEQLQHRSYDEVDIKPGAIIYCDPPYRQTASYMANDGVGFDHEKFYDWCREKSKTNPVFVSEYWMPDDFDCIYTFPRRQTLSKGETKHDEKVYYLRRQDGTKAVTA